MGYVPGFKNDVFISYAHADNLSPRDDEEGWITKLHRSLLALLPAKVGRGEGLTIYQDKKLEGNDEFADVLNAEYRQSAVIVSILTPSYLASDWCLRELKGFCEVRHPGFELKVGNKSRVFKVMPSPHIPPHEHPEAMRGSLGYPFYAINQITKDEEQFRRTGPEDPDQRYWKVLDDLARDLAAILREMKKIAEGAAEGAVVPSPTEATGPAVYLAEVTDDLLDYRDQLKRHLEQQGCRILPRTELPLTKAELAETLAEDLAQAELSIHLLGPFYGRKPAGEENLSFSQLQYAKAVEAGGAKKLPRIVWLKDVPELSQVADARQKAFLQSLENEPGLESQVELLKVGLEELKDIILSKIRPPVSNMTEENPFFYISCKPEDNEQARRILSCLRAEQYEGVVSPPEDSTDEATLRKHHRSNLKRCDVFMILYGRAPELWVQEKALEARDVALRRKKKPMSLSVCSWPPPAKSELSFNLKNMHVIEVGEEVRCDDVKRLLRKIKN